LVGATQYESKSKHRTLQVAYLPTNLLQNKGLGHFLKCSKSDFLTSKVLQKIRSVASNLFFFNQSTYSPLMIWQQSPSLASHIL